VSRVAVNGINIEYESLGAGEPLLLVMGLGMQLVFWPDEFCQALVERGFRVIRFDNRDVGQSTSFASAGVPTIPGVAVRSTLRFPAKVPYRLADMAKDAAGLLDALAIESAHIVGASMGGMIGQLLAIRYPHKVRSLTSIMSSTGEARYAIPHPAVWQIALWRTPRTREQAIDFGVRLFDNIGGTGFAQSETWLRDTIGRAFDRGFDRQGVARQLAAVVSSSSRHRALRSVHIPSSVIHGDEDPLVPVGAGIATARAIPGSRLRIIQGMGHDLRPGTWGAVLEEVTRVADRGRGRSA
jgi:pimeloyl-ACP methyl ester carboxylesterase